MKVRNILYRFLLVFSLVIPGLGNNKVLIQTFPQKQLQSAETIFTHFFGDSCFIILENGELSFYSKKIKTNIPFILNQDIPWNFVTQLKFKEPVILYNLNLDIDWYISINQGKQWRKIDSRSLKITSPGTYDFRFSYTPSDSNDPLRILSPKKYPGFWTPLFYQKLKPLHFTFVDFQRIDQRALFRVEVTDSSFLNKKLFFAYKVNGISNTFTKTFSSMSEDLSIAFPLNTPIKGNANLYNFKISIYHKKRPIKLFEKTFSVSDFQYHAPYFLLNQEKFQLRIIHIQPDFMYASLYVNPDLLQNIFIKLKKLGFNAIIIPANYLSPLVLHLANKNGMFTIPDNINEHNYLSLYSYGFLNIVYSLGPVLFSSSARLKQTIRNQFYFKRFYVRSNDFTLSKISSHEIPIYYMEYLEPEITTSLLHEWNKSGGIFEYAGYGFTYIDSLRLRFNPFHAFLSILNILKEKSRIPASYAMIWLHPFLNKYPISYWENGSFFRSPPMVFLNNKSVQDKTLSPFLDIANSPLPHYIESPEKLPANSLWYIATGLIVFFLFIFYFKSLKPFQVYFLRALRRSRSFFMDLNEKIAVPWNETLLLNTFIGMGLALSLGSFANLYYKMLPVNLIINIFSNSPSLAEKILYIFSKPYLNILLFFVLYWIYLFLLSIISKICALIFRRSMRFRYAFAMVSWSHIWFSLTILSGMILYNTIIRYSIGIEFLYLLVFLFVISFLRLLNALKISLGILKYKINLFFFLFLLLIGIILYFTNYPFKEVWDSLMRLNALYF